MWLHGFDRLFRYILQGVSFRGKEAAHGAGLRTGMYKRGKLPKGASQAPGPAVTSFIDVRKKRGGFMMEDLTVPSAFLPPYLVGSAMSCGAMRKPETYPSGQQWHTLMKVSFRYFFIFFFSRLQMSLDLYVCVHVCMF